MALLSHRPARWQVPIRVAIVTGLACAALGGPARGQDAEVVSLLGRGEAKETTRADWRLATIAQRLRGGAFVRTGDLSTMALLLHDQTQLRINQNSLVQIKDASAGAPTRIGLEAGRAWMQSKAVASRPAGVHSVIVAEMTAVVMRHGGTVDKFIGDAVMAFWGAPIADPDQSKRALDAALDMQRVTAATRAELVAAGGPALRMRIGLHRGECIVGNMGGSGRFAYTAVGDCVNLASRIEGVNEVYGTSILLSESVARALPDRCALRKVDTVRVKGRLHPVALYTPCDDSALVALSASALGAYEQGDWHEAVAQWERLAVCYPDDPVARVFVARLREWERQGWPAPWDGVATLASK